MQYHVSHHVLPKPGSDADLMRLLEGLVTPLLDRNLPLWQCFLIEGLANDRFALAFKAHHALIDGQGGLNIILDALSRSPRERKARALWGDNTAQAPHRPARRQVRHGDSRAAGALIEKLGGRVSALLGAAPRAGDLAHTVRALVSGETARQVRDLWPFKAPRSRLSQPARSSARRFGFGDLPLTAVKACAREHGTTVNDVLLSVVDAAVHRYLRETGAPMDKALVTGLPVSVRKAGDTRTGNQAGAVTVRLGAPDAAPLERLHAIHAATVRAKAQAQQLPGPAVMGYGALLLGLPALLERVQGLSAAMPMINLGISNVSPPKGADYLGRKLYLRGAHMQGLYAQPILPPSVLLNVTIGSIEDTLCLGIASTQEAIADPMLLARYIGQAFEALREAGQPATARPGAKHASARK
jgi:WS/DGAT/MGAT family acyltransferase